MRLDIDLTQGKTKRNVFFTSDFHMYHQNVLKFDDRPFNDVHEMHIAIEERWNDVVGPDDVVVYLGDLSFARGDDKSFVEGMMNNLNGTIHYVLGNHDRVSDIKKINKFASVQDYLEVNIKYMQLDESLNGVYVKRETLFCCMHYPILEWNKKYHGNSFMIHGHCHMNLFNNDKDWFDKISEFSKYIPNEQLDEYNKLIGNKHYYKGKVVDVGCMGWDYRPVSYLDILTLDTSVA